MLTKFSRRFRDDRRASVAVFFAFAALPVFAMVGAAVDYGREKYARTQMQIAMDLAVIAAATESNTSAASAFTANVAQSRVTVSGTPSFVNNADGSITGSATATLPTAIMGIVGIKTMSISVSATVAMKPGASKQTTTTTTSTTAGKVCALLVSPTASQAFLNNGAVINAPNCEFDVASNATPAAMFDTENITVGKFCVKGTATQNGGGTVPNLATGCTVAANPFKNALPTGMPTSCTNNGQNFSGTVNLIPGVYCGGYNFNGGNGTINLAPGLYVFKSSGWNLGSNWTINGTGVTFYFSDANSFIQLNANDQMTVSAPTSGIYANILMFEPDGLSQSNWPIDGNSTHSFTGLMYLPSRNVMFNASSSVSSENLTMVFNTLILNNGTITIAPNTNAISSPTWTTTSTTTTTTTVAGPSIPSLTR